MAGKAKKKYEYHTKALQLPDGIRKYIRARPQEELSAQAFTGKNAKAVQTIAAQRFAALKKFATLLQQSYQKPPQNAANYRKSR